ncbi:hypothetical protein, partial [Cellulomonas bogoriensis]|uniref:hypothetical protein n=1 Tax=Cellulomonas bogoriensis TaxID=301388 RepID=UPI00054D54A4
VGGTVLAAGATTVTLDGPVTVSPGTPVAVVVDGWHSGADLVLTDPPPAVTCSTGDPARPCEATLTVRDGWATGYNLDLTIRDVRPGNANNPVPWRVTIDFSAADVPFVPTGLEGSGVVVESSCGDLPRVTFSGVTTWGEHHLLRRGDSRTVWLQARDDGSGGILRCP